VLIIKDSARARRHGQILCDAVVAAEALGRPQVPWFPLGWLRKGESVPRWFSSFAKVPLEH